MQGNATDGIFDDVHEFPDADVKRRFERLVGLDAVKERLTKEAMMRLQPSSLEDWSKRHFKDSLPALHSFNVDHHCSYLLEMLEPGKRNLLRRLATRWRERRESQFCCTV